MPCVPESDLRLLGRWGRLLADWPPQVWIDENANKHVRASPYWEIMERTQGGSHRCGALNDTI